MKSLNIKYLYFLSIVFFLSSCSKEYGYEFEDGVNVPSDVATGKIDTNMNYVDRSLFNRARIFPGVVGAAEPRLQDKKVVFDFNYVPARDLRVNVSPYGIHSTGLYAATGELVKVVVPEGVVDLVIQIGVHTDNLSGKINLQRDPVIYTTKSLFPGVNYIRSLYGGTIWIKSRTPVVTPVELTFSNVVEAPDFVLGEMTNEEWINKIRNSTVPWLELRSKQVVYSISREMVMRFIESRRLTDPTKVMEEWDKIYEYDYYNWMGLTVGNTNLKHRAPDLPERGVLDIQISVGYGHNGYPWMAVLDEGWSESWLDLNVILNGGGWGTWHEVGHNYQQPNWSWAGLGETTNNLFIFKTADRVSKETGRRVFPQHPNLAITFPLALAFAANPNAKDFDKEESPFFKLVPFLQLYNTISNPVTRQDGWDFMAYLYTKSRNAARLSNNIQDRKDFFYESLCEYTQTDFYRFMTAWGIYISPQSRRIIAAKGYPKLDKEIWKYNPITNTGGDTPLNPKYDHPRAGWSITGSSFSNDGAGLGTYAAAIDGNINTYWHSQYGPNLNPPHYLIVDLKDQLSIKGFYLVDRQGGGNGRPKSMEISISNNNITWETVLVLTGLPSTNDRQEFELPEKVSARFVKYEFKENSYSGVHTTVAEMGTYDID